MKNFAIGMAVVVALIILWAALQSIEPNTSKRSNADKLVKLSSSGGG